MWCGKTGLSGWPRSGNRGGKSGQADGAEKAEARNEGLDQNTAFRWFRSFRRQAACSTALRARRTAAR
jgi:hypothetical protein